MYGYCITCDQKLTGRQRYYCSNQCRKRYERLAAQWPVLADKQPLSVAFGRDATSLGHDATAIATVIVIKYEATGPANMSDGMSRFAVRSLYRPQVAASALKVLESLFPGWKFELIRLEVNITE